MGNNICIGLAGDVMLGRLVNLRIPETNYAYPWGDMLNIMKKADLNIVNLETTLTNSEEKVVKIFTFKATPDKVESLKQGNIKVVNIANNHILDYSIEGLEETIETLEKAGIRHCGAGSDIWEAERAAIANVKGLRVAILGFTDNEPQWRANSSPGTNFLSIGDLEKFNRCLLPVLDISDLVIVSIHWGANLVEVPSQKFQEFAHQMIDSGADLIHGHSAHIFQGIELYKNKLIIYDAGDFVDDYAVTPWVRNDLSFYFSCEFIENRLTRVKLIPVKIAEMQVNRATGPEKEWCIKHIRNLSKDLKYGADIYAKGEIIL